VRPGAHRIETAAPHGLQGVAFVNPGGERVLLVLNEDPDPVEFRIRDSGQDAGAVLPGKSVATYVWRAPPQEQ